MSCKPVWVVCVTQKQEGSNRNHTHLSSYFGQFDCETGIKLHSMWHYKGIDLAFIDKVSRPTFEKCFLQWVTEILMRYDGDECSLKSCLITLNVLKNIFWDAGHLDSARLSQHLPRNHSTDFILVLCLWFCSQTVTPSGHDWNYNYCRQQMISSKVIMYINLCTVGCILWAVMLSVYIIKSVHTCSESDLLWPGSGRLGSAALPQTPKHLSPSPRRVRWRDMRPRAALESSSRHTSDPCTRSPLLQGS